jgi:hypothetical protein
MACRHSCSSRRIAPHRRPATSLELLRVCRQALIGACDLLSRRRGLVSTTPIQGPILSTASEDRQDDGCNGNAHVLARHHRGPFHRALHRLDELGVLDLLEPSICSLERRWRLHTSCFGIAPSRLALAQLCLDGLPGGAQLLAITGRAPGTRAAAAPELPGRGRWP